MILYNVTINIDHEVHDEWLIWMKEDHIPKVMATGRFVESRMGKVLAQDQGGVTYSIQYLAPDMESYHRYVHQEAPALQAEHSERYKDRFVAFRTIIEVVYTHGQS
ncbi:MAG: DUF4286 family protein [Flavobacteriales bacterium]|nr:DUF4286 family protein [Flavobacteriales bacterium]